MIDKKQAAGYKTILTSWKLGINYSYPNRSCLFIVQVLCFTAIIYANIGIVWL